MITAQHDSVHLEKRLWQASCVTLRLLLSTHALSHSSTAQELHKAYKTHLHMQLEGEREAGVNAEVRHGTFQSRHNQSK